MGSGTSALSCRVWLPHGSHRKIEIKNAFFNQRLINFICHLIPKVSKGVSSHEVIVALLNLYRFVALYDRTHGNLLDLEKAKSKFRKETLKSVEEALLKEMASAAPSAEYNLLTFVIDVVAEVLQGLEIFLKTGRTTIAYDIKKSERDTVSSFDLTVANI